jgi:hypothetical protein
MARTKQTSRPSAPKTPETKLTSTADNYRGEWVCTKDFEDEEFVPECVGVNQYLLDDLTMSWPLTSYITDGFEIVDGEIEKVEKFNPLRINATTTKWMVCMLNGHLYLFLYNLYNPSKKSVIFEKVYYEEILDIWMLQNTPENQRLLVSVIFFI